MYLRADVVDELEGGVQVQLERLSDAMEIEMVGRNAVTEQGIGVSVGGLAEEADHFFCFFFFSFFSPVIPPMDVVIFFFFFVVVAWECFFVARHYYSLCPTQMLLNP